MLEVRRTDAEAEDAKEMMSQLSDTLRGITGNGGEAGFDPKAAKAPKGAFLVAYEDETACGCAAVIEQSGDTAEIKRVFAKPNKCGVGSAVLRQAEKTASELGYHRVVLETREINARAMAFYQKNGYIRCENYGRYIGRQDAICYSKAV